MIYLTFHPGVTFSLLFWAIAETAENAPALLKGHVPTGRKNQKHEHALAALLRSTYEQATVDQIILTLKSGCSRLPPLSAEEAISFNERRRDETRSLPELANLNSIDPFKFSAYISLAVFFAHCPKTWKLLAPDIGAGSDERVFSILKAMPINISVASPAVSPFLAGFLRLFMAPFIERTGGGTLESASSGDSIKGNACGAFRSTRMWRP